MRRAPVAGAGQGSAPVAERRKEVATEEGLPVMRSLPTRSTDCSVATETGRAFPQQSLLATGLPNLCSEMAPDPGEGPNMTFVVLVRGDDTSPCYRKASPRSGPPGGKRLQAPPIIIIVPWRRWAVIVTLLYCLRAWAGPLSKLKRSARLYVQFGSPFERLDGMASQLQMP